MINELDEALEKARRLVKENRQGEAMSLANKVIEEHGDNIETWILRAYLYELSKNFLEAVEDLTQGIALNAREPHVYYTRGRLYFQLQDLNSALEDFTKALELCDSYKNDYYRDELLFWRAEASLKLGNRDKALEDLENVRDDFMTWTYALRTKQDLIADCRR